MTSAADRLRELAQHPPSRLLFPRYRTGEEAMLTDFRKRLDSVAVRAGWNAGDIRSKIFRHTYYTATLARCATGVEYRVEQHAAKLGARSVHAPP